MSKNTKEPTLEEWLIEWLDTYKRCSVRQHTADYYRYIIVAICRYPEAQQPLSQFTPKKLQKFLNTIACTPYGKDPRNLYSKSTLSSIRLTLRQAFRQACKDHMIQENPALELRLPLAKTKVVLPLTVEQQAVVEEASMEDPLGHLIRFLLLTGLRRAELQNLQWIDYNAKKQRIFIRESKTEAGVRYVDLIQQAQEIIEAQPQISRYIFTSTIGKPVTDTVMRRLYERLRKKTGIEGLTNHVCRHTFVTRMCERGASPKAIAQIIGHAKTDYVMDIYAWIEQGELRKAIHMMERKKEASNIVMIRFSQDELAALREEAANCKVSVAELIRGFVVHECRCEIEC